MHKNNFKIGFLFDLDGVIIDSEREYSRIWRQINKEIPTGIENLEIIIKGCTLEKILEDFYQTDLIRTQVKERLHFLENQMHYDYLEYAQEFLKELTARNLSKALVTSSDQMKMRHLHEIRPELRDYFDCIVTGNMVRSSKPSPEGYLLAAEKLNIEPKNCVVFEDSLQGVKAGKNAGAFVIAVVGTLAAEMLAPYSDLMINNFSELYLDELIEKVAER